MNLTGNTVLITGGGTGIGKSLAKQFHKRGNKVIICGRRENKLLETVQELPGIHYVVCDIADSQDRNNLFNYVKENFPDLNILINNAAVQTDYDLTKGIDALGFAEQEININLTAPIMLTGLFIPMLMEQKNPAIINVSSILGFTPLKRIPMYCAAKAGYHVYTMELREHLKDTPVEVYEVPPVRVETDLNPSGRANAKPGTESVGLQPDEYTDYVIEQLEKGNLDIFYPPTGELVMNHPRYEVELSRLF